MAGRLDPENIQAMRQSLHHLVAKAPWSDETLLDEVRNRVLPAMQKQGPVVAWIVDDTGFPKKGKHSVGVTRQYCGQVGKQENCRVAVSLSVATWSSSLPIAYRLYLPKEWAEDAERREQTEVPEEVEFQTKPDIALDQIRAAVAAGVARGVVLADAAYGTHTEFRDGLTALRLPYAVGVQSSMTVWESGKRPLPAKPRGKMGRPPRLLQRSADHQPVSVKQVATSLPSTAFREITWREGTDRRLRSRFAAVRVRPAHRDYEKAEPHAEEWLLIEWPRGEAEPTKYWISTLPQNTKLKGRCLYRGSVARNSSTTGCVVPCSPKNCRRISLSIPTTSQPWAESWRTHSEPMSPPDPVTRAFIAKTHILFPGFPFWLPGFLAVYIQTGRWGPYLQPSSDGTLLPVPVTGAGITAIELAMSGA